MKTAMVIVAFLLGVIVRAALAAEAALTNDDIVRLTKVGVGEEVIVAMIAASPVDFETTVDCVVELADAGVADKVITAMVNATKRTAPEGSAATAGSTFRDGLRSGGTGPEMVVIPEGRFWMGCVSGKDCYDDGKPVHEVVMVRPFALSVHEVTFDDYERMASARAVDDRGWGRARRPVINVSWNDAQDYVGWLSEQTGVKYRLPTEAEWEYAARAGSTRQWHFGNDQAELCGYANHLDLSSDSLTEERRKTVLYLGRNLACSDGFGDRTAPVGSLAPNPWGLRDMHGNVFEWVEDCWNENYVDAPGDGRAWLQGDCEKRVMRGGAWGSTTSNVTAAFRYAHNQNVGADLLGFRVARTLPLTAD